MTVRDNGIGMHRDEVVANIGTIASSGTRRFLAALGTEQKADARLIGQFGVGFYSAFVVADRVTVLTRQADAPASEGVKWESDGRGEYTLETVELPERGTTVVLHLKPDEDEFLDGWQLRSLIHRYSEHVAFPIRMPKETIGQGRSRRDGAGVGNRQRGVRAVDQAQERDFRRGLPGLLQVAGPRFQRSAGVDPQPRRGQPELHHAAVPAVAAAVRADDGRPRRAQGAQALHQARVRDGRRRGAAAELPALRPRRGRRRRPAAQRQPRTAAAEPPARPHQDHAASSACST